MPQDPTTRARQHLLLQGFTIYPCHAAVCVALVARGVLGDPGRAWAIEFGADSQRWTSMLPNDDDSLLAQSMRQAALMASADSPHVLTHTRGGLLLTPLAVTDVREARMRIEAAVALGKTPAAERLEAFPDELIEREARRRARAKTSPLGANDGAVEGGADEQQAR